MINTVQLQQPKLSLSFFYELSVAPRLREATMVTPRAPTEAPRKPRERSMTPSRRIATTDTSRSLHGAFVESSRSLPGAFPQSQISNRRFHNESAIPSAQPCGVSCFGLGLGLGLRLCKKISTEPPRLMLHGAFM